MIKELVDWLKNSFIQLIQFFCLLVALVLPSILDLKSAVPSMNYLNLNITGLFKYLAIKCGNAGIGVLFFGVFVAMLHNINKSKTLNKGNVYHTHGMVWYWLCSNVLGYGACNLARVPIATQFLLVLNDTFKKYVYSDIPEEADADSRIQLFNYPADNETCSAKQSSWVNLLISDTYQIELNQIPIANRMNKTIAITNLLSTASHTRVYSPRLVNEVTTAVRNLAPGSKVNIFATTNPKNTYEIIDKAFKLGGRDNLAALYVYRQRHRNAEDGWIFSDPVMVFHRS